MHAAIEPGSNWCLNQAQGESLFICNQYSRVKNTGLHRGEQERYRFPLRSQHGAEDSSQSTCVWGEWCPASLDFSSIHSPHLLNAHQHPLCAQEEIDPKKRLGRRYSSHSDKALAPVPTGSASVLEKGCGSQKCQQTRVSLTSTESERPPPNDVTFPPPVRHH